MNPIIKGLILAVVISLSNDFILGSVYSIFSSHNSYLTITHDHSQYFKYFFIASVFAFVFLRYGSVEGFGKFVLWLFILAGIVGSIGAIVWYDAASPEGVVQQRLWGKTEYTWDQLKQVSTKGELDYSDSDNKKAIFEYTLQFNDGTIINMWTEDVTKLQELDTFLSSKQILVHHEYVNHVIKDNLQDYVSGDIQVVKKLLGIYE